MQNQTLIILPGWDGTKETWQKFANIAGKYFNVQILELPCFGDEPCPNEVWGVEEYADFVKSKIQSFFGRQGDPLRQAQGRLSTLRLSAIASSRSGRDDVLILGHSFGGQVAAYLAANNPGICDKLILSGPAVFRKEKSFKRTFFFILAKSGKWCFKLPALNKFEKLAKKILYKAADCSDYVKTSGIKRKIFQKIIKQDVSDLLPKISIPTLVVCGSEDKCTPLTNGKKIAKMIPGAKLEIFQGGRHGLHIQQPQMLFEVIQSFISK